MLVIELRGAEIYECNDHFNRISSATRVLMQLQLKGLTKIDKGLSQQFRASVPGYDPLPAPAPPESQFSDYQ